MPIDADPMQLCFLPDRARPYSIDPHKHGGVHLVPYTQDFGPFGAAYVSHFVTCAHASKHSRRAKRGGDLA